MADEVAEDAVIATLISDPAFRKIVADNTVCFTGAMAGADVSELNAASIKFKNEAPKAEVDAIMDQLRSALAQNDEKALSSVSRRLPDYLVNALNTVHINITTETQECAAGDITPLENNDMTRPKEEGRDL